LSADVAGHFGVTVATSAPEPEWHRSFSSTEPYRYGVLDSSNLAPVNDWEILGPQTHTESTFGAPPSPLHIADEDRVGSNIDPNDSKAWWATRCANSWEGFVAAPLTGDAGLEGDLDHNVQPVQVRTLKDES
jgi:hypothetical protein